MAVDKNVLKKRKRKRQVENEQRVSWMGLCPRFRMNVYHKVSHFENEPHKKYGEKKKMGKKFKIQKHG